MPAFSSSNPDSSSIDANTAVLKDAQVNPANHRDLVVRVSGYCAYFTDLGKSIQDDIISRTQFADLS